MVLSKQIVYRMNDVDMKNEAKEEVKNQMSETKDQWLSRIKTLFMAIIVTDSTSIDVGCTDEIYERIKCIEDGLIDFTEAELEAEMCDIERFMHFVLLVRRIQSP
jgi:hypothetical protein